MNIDKENFEEVVEAVKKGIDESEFVAFDLELSGISKSAPPTLRSFVNAEAYYEAHKCISSTLQILQVGICTFKHTSGEGKEKQYACMPYNFYIFPEFHGKRGEDNLIRFSADAVQFLRNYKFDFNRTFYKGVPYMRKDAEQKVTEFWDGYFAKQRDVELKPDDEAFVNNLSEKVSEGINKILGKTDETFTIGKFVEFDWKQRKLIYQEIPKRFPKTVVEKAQLNGHDSMVVRYDPTALTGFEKKKKEIQGWVGFRHVIDHLAKSGKPVVGHNCFLDLLFMMQSFSADLEQKSFSEFKKLALECFGVVFDTKTAINELVPTMKETGLEKVYNFVTNGEFDKLHPNKVTCTLDPSVTYTHSAHEAGYDAYMTGMVFAKQKAVATPEQLEKLANCVFLFACEQSPMTLTRQEDDVDLTRMYLVNDFPSAFTNDTFQEAARFGANVRVKWIDDTSCLVVLQNDPSKEEIAKVTERVKNIKDWVVVVLSEQMGGSSSSSASSSSISSSISNNSIFPV